MAQRLLRRCTPSARSIRRLSPLLPPAPPHHREISCGTIGNTATVSLQRGAGCISEFCQYLEEMYGTLRRVNEFCGVGGCGLSCSKVRLIGGIGGIGGTGGLSDKNLHSVPGFGSVRNLCTRSLSSVPPVEAGGEKDHDEENVVPSRRVSWTMGPGQQPVPVGAAEEGNSGADRSMSLWPGMYHSPVTAALWRARASIREREGKHGAGVVSALVISRTPSMSRTSVLYALAGDEILREQYRNPWNGCRIGKLLEDLDALAGTIAMKHCSDDNHMTRPLLLVTASVDKISMKKPLCVGMDLMMKGTVAWVGRSSMEIRMEVIQPVQERTGKDDIALIANFTFVARDSKTKKAALVNKLVPESEEEKLLYAMGEAKGEFRKRQRKQGNNASKEAVDKQRLKELLSEGRILCEMPALADRDTVLIRHTKLENAIICQPQQRNMHGRIFGGFLMRRAYELAFSTCYVFAGTRPLFLEVDHVDFRKPVDVGNLLRFKSCVLYTEVERTDRPLIHVEVVAYVTQPEKRSSEISNTFYFTFSLDPELLRARTTPVRRVLPETEEEARGYLARYDADHLVTVPAPAV